MDAYRRFPLGPEPGHDDAAATRNAASSDPVSGPGSDGAPAGESEVDVTPTAGDEQESDGAAVHEHQVRRDLDELTAKAEKADEYLELAKRTKADFENYRKRTARDAAAAQTRGVIKLVRDLLPAVDNLDRAAVAALNGGTETDEVASGVKLV